MGKSYYDQIFERCDLRNVAWHIQNGEPLKRESENFGIREENAHRGIEKLIALHLPKESRLDFENAVDGYTHIYAENAFVLGMKIGARLIAQLLTDPSHDYL